MTRYDRYFFVVFLQSLLLVTALTTTIFLVVDVLINLDKIQNFPDVSRGTALYYAYNLPPVLYLMFPLIVVAAGMFSIVRMERGRELLVLEAAGVSRKRALMAILIPALLLGVLGIVTRQLVLPELHQARRASPYGAYEFRKGKRISVRDDAGNIWFVRRYDLSTQSLQDIRILSRDGRAYIVVKELKWQADPGIWHAPFEGTVHDLGALTDPDEPGEPMAEPVAPRKFRSTLPFGHLLPADLARRRRGHEENSLTELWHEARLRPDHRQLRSALWHELWHPFSGLLLLVCGAGLVLSRSGRKPGRSASMFVVCVLGYQIMGFWFETLGIAGAYSPEIGASLAPISFGVLGLALFHGV